MPEWNPLIGKNQGQLVKCAVFHLVELKAHL